MRRPGSVQVAQSGERATAKLPLTVDDISRNDARRSAVAWRLDQLSEYGRSLLGYPGIEVVGFWHKLEVRQLMEDENWRHQRGARALLPDLCKPLQEGIL